MSRILIVGNGQHTNNRILPALKSLDRNLEITILARSKENSFEKSNSCNLIKYENLVSSMFFDLIIVATYPSNHFEIVNKLKNFSSKFCIEKPLSNNFREITTFFEDSKNSNIEIFESLMYLYHPLYSEIIKYIKNKEILNFKAVFNVPFHSKNNFRNLKKYGGGAFLDQGIYPVSITSELFDSNIILEDSKIFQSKNKHITSDIGGYANFSCNGVKIINEFYLGKEYENYILIETKNEKIKAPFIFSKPENYNSYFLVNNQFSETRFEVDQANQFQLMYSDILNNKKKSFNKYEQVKKRYNLMELIENNND